MLVAMTPRVRIAVLKAPTPAEPALVRGKRNPDHFEQPAQSLLLLARGLPVSSLSMVPQPHVTLRIHVGETRDDTMRSHLEGGVDDDLRARHEEDVGGCRRDRAGKSGSCRHRRSSP